MAGSKTLYCNQETMLFKYTWTQSQHYLSSNSDFIFDDKKARFYRILSSV